MTEHRTVSNGFKRLTIATTIAIYLLIIAGGVVRVTNSGLGCPDWPLCYGQIIPPMHLSAWIEYTHRLTASVAGTLILTTTFIAWRRYSHITSIALPTALIVSLLVVQIPLGAFIVASELEAIAIAFHLGMALFIFGASIVTSISAHFHTEQGQQILKQVFVPPSYIQLLVTTLIGLFLLLLSGALVVGNNASYACPDWPLCHGQVLPTVIGPQIATHLTHRIMVGLVSILIITTVLTTFRQPESMPGLTRWAGLLAILLTLQIIIGAVQIWTELADFWRAAHLATGSAVWGTLVSLSSIAFLLPYEAPNTETLPKSSRVEAGTD